MSTWPVRLIFNLALFRANFKDYIERVVSKVMGKETIGGRPTTIKKEGSEIKVVFHPINGVKHPEDAVFAIKMGKTDISKLQKWVVSKTQAKEAIGGWPATVEKIDGGLKVVFHPRANNAKNPEAKRFSTIMDKSDISKLQKCL